MYSAPHGYYTPSRSAPQPVNTSQSPRPRFFGETTSPLRSPPLVTPIAYPSSSTDVSSESPTTPPDLGRLDELWEELRREKETKLARTAPKVRSLEDAGETPLTDIISDDRLNAISPNPRYTEGQGPSTFSRSFESGPSSPSADALGQPTVAVRKRKSLAILRESQDGRTITATFDMSGIEKQDVHISFQRNRLVLNWMTVNVTESEERGKVVRERTEQRFNRIIPLPEGTRFEQVRASMDSRRLTLTYPSMRASRHERIGTPLGPRAPEERIEYW